MEASNRIIQSLWIGKHLTVLELLTLKSFIAFGHEFHLYVYDVPETALPPQVLLKNAADIIPQSQVFKYNHASKMGHGKGSFAGFSDIFRYKLLLDKGGWWVDMDITCLHQFDFDTPYFFRDHHALKLVGNVIKVPPSSLLMQQCYERAIKEITSENTDWHKPIEILNEAVFDLNLQNYIRHNVSNLDLWRESTSKFVKKNIAIPLHYYFIHWQNEAWNHLRISKQYIPYQGTLGKLLAQYNLNQTKHTTSRNLYNRIYNSKLLTNLRMLDVWT